MVDIDESTSEVELEPASGDLGWRRFTPTAPTSGPSATTGQALQPGPHEDHRRPEIPDKPETPEKIGLKRSWNDMGAKVAESPSMRIPPDLLYVYPIQHGRWIDARSHRGEA